MKSNPSLSESLYVDYPQSTVQMVEYWEFKQADTFLICICMFLLLDFFAWVSIEFILYFLYLYEMEVAY